MINKIAKFLAGITLLIILIVILSKPSYNSFNEYATGINVKPYKVVTKKLNDYFVYAIYQKEVYKWDADEHDYILVSTEKYKAYLLNFHKM
jgi:hypothetical protein